MPSGKTEIARRLLHPRRRGARGPGWGCLAPYFFDRLQPDVRRRSRTPSPRSPRLARRSSRSTGRGAAASAAGFVICRPETRRGPRAHAARLSGALWAGACDRDWRRSPSSRAATTSARAGRATVHPAVDRRSLSGSTISTALITPTTPATATDADALTIAYPDGEEPVHAGFTRFTMPFNTTGQPALSIPCGFDRDGLPIGMQIIGRPYEETPNLRLAMAFEGTDRRSTATRRHVVVLYGAASILSQRTSKASRSASPKRLRPRTMRKIAAPGAITVFGARVR